MDHPLAGNVHILTPFVRVIWECEKKNVGTSNIKGLTASIQIITKGHGIWFLWRLCIMASPETLLERAPQQLLSELHLGVISVILCHRSQVSIEEKFFQNHPWRLHLKKKTSKNLLSQIMNWNPNLTTAMVSRIGTSDISSSVCERSNKWGQGRHKTIHSGIGLEV